MAKETVNWDSQETWQRVVASIIATGVKLDYRQIALYFGTTYDTIEKRFRKSKKDAVTLRAEIESGERGEVTPARKSAPTTPKKPKGTPPPKLTPLMKHKPKEGFHKVIHGRIAKATTPKGGKKSNVKKEAEDDFLSMPCTNSTSFEAGREDDDNDEDERPLC